MVYIFSYIKKYILYFLNFVFYRSTSSPPVYMTLRNGKLVRSSEYNSNKLNATTEEALKNVNSNNITNNSDVSAVQSESEKLVQDSIDTTTEQSTTNLDAVERTKENSVNDTDGSRENLKENINLHAIADISKEFGSDIDMFETTEQSYTNITSDIPDVDSVNKDASAKESRNLIKDNLINSMNTTAEHISISDSDCSIYSVKLEENNRINNFGLKTVKLEPDNALEAITECSLENSVQKSVDDSDCFIVPVTRAPQKQCAPLKPGKSWRRSLSSFRRSSIVATTPTGKKCVKSLGK